MPLKWVGDRLFYSEALRVVQAVLRAFERGAADATMGVASWEVSCSPLRQPPTPHSIYGVIS